MDAIGRQVTAFVTLSMAVGLILLMYLIFEPQRREASADEALELSSERGAHLFAENCVICHGATGQGIAGAGFPLNTEDNQFPDDERRELLRRTLHQGRQNSTGNLPNMPAFLNANGGPLNAQMIEDLVNFMGYGNWNEVPRILEGELGTPVAALPPPPELGTPIPRGAGPAAAGPGSNDPGAQVFNQQCVNCHRISPEFPNGAGVGPNLTGIAIRTVPSRAPTVANPLNIQEQGKAGLTRWIRNPQDIRPGSAMPAFGPDQIPDEQMSQLTDWLMTHTTPPEPRRRR